MRQTFTIAFLVGLTIALHLAPGLTLPVMAQTQSQSPQQSEPASETEAESQNRSQDEQPQQQRQPQAEPQQSGQASETEAESRTPSQEEQSQPEQQRQPQAEEQQQTRPPQQQPAPSEPESQDQAETTRGWNAALDSVQQALARRGLNDRQLVEFTTQINNIEALAEAAAAELTPQVEALEEQLQQLGEPPEDGAATEAPELTERRSSLNDRKAQLEGLMRGARLIAVRARQLEGDVIAERRNRFVRSLTEQSVAIIDPSLWRNAASGTIVYGRSLLLLLIDSFNVTVQRFASSPGTLLRTIFAVLIGSLVYVYLTRILQAHAARPRKPSKASELYRPAIMHLTDLALGALLPIIFLYYLLSVILVGGVSTDRLHQFLGVVVFMVALFVSARSLLRIYLRPDNSAIRIAHLSDQEARATYRNVLAGVGAIAVLRAISGSSALMFAPIEVPVIASALVALVGLFIGARTLMLLTRDEDVDEGIPGQTILSWGTVRPLIWLALITVTLALVFGYVALAEFLVFQIVVSLMVLAFLWLVLKAMEHAKARVLSQRRGGWQTLAKTAGMKATTSRQFAVLTFGIARLTAFILAAVVILLPWGVLTQDWYNLMRRAFFGFQIGELTISLSSVLIALALFVIGFIVTRSIQRWLGTQFLPTTKLDTGLRNSITTVLGYVGIVIAAILAISAAGLNLSQLALVAGALSVGIGFGLQSIVNNFVSGLILLAERPIKNGDWVVTSGGQGMVKRISVRSTEIDTFDGSTVILPNSTLISETVTNWTHRNTMGRVIVTIGVSYSSDPEQVRELLFECAREHDLVLDDPAPLVFFMDYGADALIFDLRCYLADITYMLSVSSELRFTILRKMREAGVEIPFPQRDLHLKTVPEGWGPKEPEEKAPAASNARPAAKSTGPTKTAGTARRSAPRRPRDAE